MRMLKESERAYRGRIAPTPTGFLHLGHIATFGEAQRRANQANGTLIYRDENLDTNRCLPEYSKAAIEDLRNWRLKWEEGPDSGGSFGSYVQTKRLGLYKKILLNLFTFGVIYPSPHSRKEIHELNPRKFDNEILFPKSLRPTKFSTNFPENGFKMNWRFKIPDGEAIHFFDERLGNQSFIADKHFGDFLVWRKDGFPSYELAVVIDDHFMKISEVVRGEDLLLSTARQLLIYETLVWQAPSWFHCPLITNKKNERLSKTIKSLSLRELTHQGISPSLDWNELQEIANRYC